MDGRRTDSCKKVGGVKNIWIRVDFAIRSRPPKNVKLGRRARTTTGNKCTKRHVQSCCFANLNLLMFCRSRCRRASRLLKLPSILNKSKITKLSEKAAHNDKLSLTAFDHVRKNCFGQGNGTNSV